ncbi:MAG: MBL fold metallo-hydrolase [bacterium]|nr:MBL fold metallo-hydrolase [bacterium]
MILEHFLLSVNETNCYIVACGKTREAVIIDPGEWNDQIAQFISDHTLVLKMILITHDHSDHTGGLQEIVAKTNIPIAAHSLNSKAVKPLKDGDVLPVGELKIKTLETPGHTADSITFVVGCEIFCGDLLFAGSVGGTPDQESFEREIQSIKEKILTLGDDMVLHPGHGPATTVQVERIFNPFLMP